MNNLIIGIPKEITKGEKRVALSPENSLKLQEMGFKILLEKSAGVNANFPDKSYKDVEIIKEAKDLWQKSNIILKVNPPTTHPKYKVNESSWLKEKSTLISFINPNQNRDLMDELSSKNINVLALDCIPRISRAQSMDALSSTANISGYRAVIEAANHFGRFFTGQITAAGKVPPAKVLVIGAGVAGLAAIGCASNLGAEVRAFDTRSEVAEQIESMGGSFLTVSVNDEQKSTDGYAKTMSKEFIKAEMELFLKQTKEVDIIITTAAIPGKNAPKLITKEMVESMKDGSVIVDLAALSGGNCSLTKKDEIVEYQGKKIIGHTNYASMLANQASKLYSTNLFNLIKLIKSKNIEKETENFNLDFSDEIIRGATVIKEGKITWPAPPVKVSANLEKKQTTPEVAIKQPKKKETSFVKNIISLIIVGVFLLLSKNAPNEFISHLGTFVLSCVIGYYVVWNVTHALHTPLMSVTNAISGIIILGAITQFNTQIPIVLYLATFAVFIATINIVGGFTVTQRMLKMFQKEEG